VPSIHPAAMFLFIAFLAISVAFRKAFCGWLCPVGTLSEALWKLGRRYLKGSWRFPRWIDLPLRSLKYLLLALFVYAIAGMSAAAIEGFLSSPYGLVADVKMLNFFRFMGQTAAITIAAIAALSVLFQNFWCRYLCPYGALMGLFALVSPSRVQRDPERCIDCARCARACPSLLPVDQLVSVRSAECMACLECVAACPAKGALRLSVTPRRGLPVWALAAGIGAVFVGIVLFAKATGSWDTAIPSQLYQDLILRAHEFGHP
jgi:polyferredoxin